MSETFSKVEVITGVARQRRFTTEQKLLVVNETLQPGMSISYVARRHGLSPSLVFRWRRLMSEGGKEAVRADEDVVAASEVRRLEERIREQERLLGRKTMEVEILKDSAGHRTGKKTDLAVAIASTGGYPVKRIAETLEVARSNLVERATGSRAKHGPQTRAGDAELAADIRCLVDGRPTYGYRRIARAPQARAASRRPRPHQYQAGLSADEEERLVAGPAYRSA
jgi:transposase-like protein